MKEGRRLPASCVHDAASMKNLPMNIRTVEIEAVTPLDWIAGDKLNLHNLLRLVASLLWCYGLNKHKLEELVRIPHKKDRTTTQRRSQEAREAGVFAGLSDTG